MSGGWGRFYALRVGSCLVLGALAVGDWVL